jgi:SAM-dependent methyltransferase
MSDQRTSEAQRDWEELAQLDPEWAILSSPGKRHGGWDHDEFFATGVEHIDALMEDLAPLGLPERTGSALDFGCGLGRLTRALSDRFDDCLGLDIAPTMIAGARRLNADRPNCRFEVNPHPDLRDLPDDSFDLVLSYIVLQHVPQREVILSYVSELVRVLAPGGVACLQVPSNVALWGRLQVRRTLYHALRRCGVPPRVLYERLGLLPMAMASVPADELKDHLVSAGARVVRLPTAARSNRFLASLHYVTKDARA